MRDHTPQSDRPLRVSGQCGAATRPMRLCRAGLLGVPLALGGIIITVYPSRDEVIQPK